MTDEEIFRLFEEWLEKQEDIHSHEAVKRYGNGIIGATALGFYEGYRLGREDETIPS